MDPEHRRKLLTDFRAFYEKQPPNSDDHNCELPEFWAVMELDDLVYHEPETAWGLILELSEQDLPQNAVGCLAAGPLEDLIRDHGPAFVERIENRARVSLPFRHLLGGVWEGGDPTVWSRIAAARGAPW